MAEELKESDLLLVDIQDILKEHDNNESLIGIRHRYWDIMNRYRQLLREGK